MDCVYTALLGNYEALTEQPISHQSNIDFICLTDDPNLTSDTWEIKLIEPVLPQDMVRSQRHLKILGHSHLSKYEQTIYIDNSMILTSTPEAIFERYADTASLVLPFHSFRDSVADEFAVVARLLLDDPAVVKRQKRVYEEKFPHVLRQRPYAAGALIRKPDKKLTLAMEIWESQVMQYSRRDQLSLNMAIELSGVEVHGYEMQNYIPWFLTFKEDTGRRQDIRTWHEDGFSLKYGLRRASNRVRDSIYLVRNPPQKWPKR